MSNNHVNVNTFTVSPIVCQNSYFTSSDGWWLKGVSLTITWPTAIPCRCCSHAIIIAFSKLCALFEVKFESSQICTIALYRIAELDFWLYITAFSIAPTFANRCTVQSHVAHIQTNCAPCIWSVFRKFWMIITYNEIWIEVGGLQ